MRSNKPICFSCNSIAKGKVHDDTKTGITFFIRFPGSVKVFQSFITFPMQGYDED